MDKIGKAIKLLNEIKEEELKNKENKKLEILDKLNNVECNYFLIISNDEGGMTRKFKVYGMVADSYDRAYKICEDIFDDDYINDYWLLHKDELADMMFNIENKIIVRDYGNKTK